MCKKIRLTPELSVPFIRWEHNYVRNTHCQCTGPGNRQRAALVHESARIKYKLMGFMVYFFNLQKNKHLLLHDTFSMKKDKRIF
jgi:hypothetical protein